MPRAIPVLAAGTIAWPCRDGGVGTEGPPVPLLSPDPPLLEPEAVEAGLEGGDAVLEGEGSAGEADAFGRLVFSVPA
jgi:hypothetical protein